MKKFLLSVFIFFIASISVFARSDRKIVIIPLMEAEVGIKDAWTNGENAKILNDVGAHFESNIFEYTNFDIVNNANKDEIIKIQREVETSGLYDESTIPEIGIFTGATHALYANIRNTSSGYTITARIVEIYGENRTITAKPVTRASAEELSGVVGSAVDEITIDLCKKLGPTFSKSGMPLSPAQEHVLMKGDLDLTSDQKIAQFDNEAQLYSDQIANFTREINSLAEDTSADAGERQKNLEGLRELAKKNLEYVKEKQLIYEEEQEKIKADRELNALRTEAERERILDSSMAIAESMYRIRNELGLQRSLLSQMNSIESTKKVFVDLKEKAAYEKKLINDDAKTDIENKKLEIDSRVLLNAEKTADGSITSAARRNREKELKEYKSLREARASLDTKDIDKLLEEQQEKLIKTINENYKLIEKRTVNTITGELVVQFGPYDGERFGWDIYITVQSENMVIFKTTSFIKYEAITGKQPVTDYNAPGYHEFNADIDFYVSMFSRGEPILTFAMDMLIIPSEKDRPSEYNFTFSNLRFYETRNVVVYNNEVTGRIKGTLEPKDTIAIVQLQPAYDIHTKKELDAEAREKARIRDAEIKAEARRLAEEAAEEERFYKNLEKEKELQRKQLEKERKEMERRQKEAQAEREKAEKKQARKEAISNRPIEKDFKHSLIAVNGAYTFTDPTATSIGLEFAGGMLPFIYFDYKVNLLNLDTAKTKFYPITDPKLNFVLTNMFQIGINIPFGGVVELFGSAGAGFNWYCPIQVFTESSDFISTIDKVPYTSKFDFTLGVSAGMQIEVVRHLGLLSSYNMTYIYEKELYYHSVDVGIAFIF